MTFLRQLFFGHRLPPPAPGNYYAKLGQDLRDIWHQTHYRDFGLERLLRLALQLLAFLMPGSLFRGLVSVLDSGFLVRRSAVELFALLKVGWYVALFNLHLTHRPALLLGSLALSFDTFHFLLCRIFLADIHRRHTSFRRSLVLMVVNFAEIGCFFALLYCYLDHELARQGIQAFSRSPLTETQAVYFSFITATTVGYGDIHPVAPLLQKLVVAQIGVALFFVIVYSTTVINNLDKAGALNEPPDGK